MMASLVINSIRSALDALEKSGNIQRFNGILIKCKLQNVEIFVLCARKLDVQLRFDNEVSTLGSLLQRIHHALSRNAHGYNLEIFYNFDKEIGHWYNTMSVSLPQPTFDEVIEIIDSVLDNLYGILHCIFHCIAWGSVQPLEAMIEEITFLRNFICFATLRSVKPRQLDNLLAHIQAVAVDAAHISYMCILERDVEQNVPALLRMIKIDPQVFETYTQALTSSKLSTQLHSPIPDKDRDPSIIMKDFIDSLRWKLWGRIQMDMGIEVSTSFQLQLLYEGLRLLRSMLKEQPNKFDEEIREFTRVVICVAGAIIFSLYHKDVEEIVVSIPYLLQMINRIGQEVKGEDHSISDLLRRLKLTRKEVEGKDLPRTNELGLIDFLLENVVEMTSSKTCYGFQSQFHMIHDELSLLRNSLGKIEGVRNEQKELADLWNGGVKVAYRVEFLIDQVVFGYFQGSSSTTFDSSLEDILKEIKSINSEIHHASDMNVKQFRMTPNLVSYQNRALMADDIVGFDDHKMPIIDLLTRGSKLLKMVAIVGMPGIGKTTLATKVFNHPFVTSHFHVRLWGCVSHLFHKKKLLLHLLNLVVPNQNIEMSEQNLAENLWRHLKRKRYLIFLDDIWDIEAWNSLKESFPDDSLGSRILVTSRNRDAVPQAILSEEPYFLPLLTNDESWELLQKKLSPRNDWPLALFELGKQIAASCKGLPLTVVVVAGLLANLEEEGWKKVLRNISSDHCMNILELSYKHLPDYLKSCFLCFGLFPEGQEVSVKRLIWLWIAEGFVFKTESKCLEDAARDYMMDLVGRSLVIVSKKRSSGGVKACRIHDLLHDFCRIKAKEENFFQLLNGGYEELLSFEEPRYMLRLCVHSERKYFKNLRLFSRSMHSLLFFPDDKEEWRVHDISFIFSRCKHLRVLDISRYPLSCGIPSEIGLFVQLKFLSVCGDMNDIPLSIGSLSNLEILVIYSLRICEVVLLPDTFWNLQKLRHVAIEAGFCFASKNLEDFPELLELQSCSTAIIRHGDSTERLVRKFPNIRELHCDFRLGWEDCNEILIPDSLSRLESLHLSSLWLDKGLKFKLGPPENLRKLSLNKFLLHQSDVSRIGKLPNLEVLKFHRVQFHGNAWDMVEGEFSTLRFLKLTSSGIIRWTASDDQFPYLQKLILRFCNYLEEIPGCFESIDTLEMVEVSSCSVFVNNFFKRIQDEEMELGNSFLKISLHSNQNHSRWKPFPSHWL